MVLLSESLEGWEERSLLDLPSPLEVWLCTSLEDFLQVLT